MSRAFPSTDFATYLEAKYPVDTRSLNPGVESVFLSALSSFNTPRLLDVGCGTGAVARRLLTEDTRGTSLSYRGLDADASNIDAAVAFFGNYHDDGLDSVTVDSTKQSYRIDLAGTSGQVELIFTVGNLFDPPPDITASVYNAITAHALLDLLPLEHTIQTLVGRLAPGGILYSAINYDGRTTFLPRYTDTGFEAMLLAVYDRSMDERTLNGFRVGGSRTGTAIYGSFVEAGLEILGYGASDWSLFPFRGSYDPNDRALVQAIVEMTANEGTRHREIDMHKLESWYATRIAQCESDALSLIVHQTDIIGRWPQECESVV